MKHESNRDGQEMSRMEVASELIRQDVKVALSHPQVLDGEFERTSLPVKLTDELRRMRREPSAFTVNGRVKCGLGCGKGAAYSLTHPQVANAGTWCAVHGWIFFDSERLPPTRPTLKRTPP
jgi:hypothetical protein